MLAYWARVIRLARKIKRRTGSAGNFIPAERLGRFLRLIWNPVVMLWIGLPILHYAWERPARPFQPLYVLPAVAWGALGVALLAFIATLICWKKMGRHWRMGINPDEKTELISSGPYALVRHPIYALSSLLMLCTMAIVPSPAMLVVGVLHLMLLQWEARREERYLIHVHGDAYRDYMRRSGRFCPRLIAGGRSA